MISKIENDIENISSLRTEEVEAGRDLGSLITQSRLIGELQVSGRLWLTQKEGAMIGG